MLWELPMYNTFSNTMCTQLSLLIYEVLVEHVLDGQLLYKTSKHVMEYEHPRAVSKSLVSCRLQWLMRSTNKLQIIPWPSNLLNLQKQRNQQLKSRNPPPAILVDPKTFANMAAMCFCNDSPALQWRRKSPALRSPQWASAANDSSGETPSRIHEESAAPQKI